jgi:enamine deaminase RidA (YjgF/YER057c/UK114 family)
VSGQVDWDNESRVRHGTLEGQAEGAMEHLLTVLDEAGAAVADILQVRGFVRGELADVMPHIVPVFARHFGTTRPAPTGVGVASLASRDSMTAKGRKRMWTAGESSPSMHGTARRLTRHCRSDVRGDGFEISALKCYAGRPERP